MYVLSIVLSALAALDAVVLVFIILKQTKRAQGISGSIQGMGAQQTYWDRNKGRSAEGNLEKYTKILGGVFLILCLALNFIK